MINVVGAPEAGRDVPPEPPSELPRVLPVLPLRETVPFPETVLPLAVGQARSVALVNDALGSNRLIAMVASREQPEDASPGRIGEPGGRAAGMLAREEPQPDDLYRVGVVGTIARMMRAPDDTLRILVQGGTRVRLDEFLQTEPYLTASISELPDVVDESPELTALTRNVQQTFGEIVQQVPYLPEELQLALANLDDPIAISHLIAGSLRIDTAEKQELLEEVDVAARLRKLSAILAREHEVISIGSRIQSQVQSEVDRGQREFILRQQLKAIQEELGELDEQSAEANELREQLDAIDLPEEVRRQADRELARLERLPPAAAEHGVIRGYLEWIASLPWDKSTEDNLDLDHAREVLDDDHYDIEQVKDRILEFLAVRKLKRDARGSIMCFVGPPGVGKTSLGRSIARALGRNFERISVGGVRDESEIRGHRRTYIGALPGTIIRAIRDAGSNNPLLMIDEIDKMGADFRGDPASAMLEVLDPEQNHSFRDHYLDLPFDLSRCIFVCTANDLDRVPGPLRDRMEVIQLAGYTEEEKLEIGRRYLVTRQIERSGLTRGKIAFSDPAVRAIIRDYTREAGVRQLEREIGSVCRKVALEYARGTRTRKLTVSEKRVRELLGRPRFHAELRRRTSEPGVATGLAWTPVGGDVLFVEATAMPGKGRLTITGQLGDVMRESAEAGVSYVRGHSRELPEDWFGSHDLHVHVPAGAIPKDGPSAGITIATALRSLVTGQPVRDDVAMTGEITLTGQVLPIGGLKEKALAAQRYGIKLVIAPKLNEGDCEDFPEHLRQDVEFRFLDHVEEVFELALEPARPASRARRRRRAGMLTPAAASKTREFNGSEEDSG
jgi:ATP-dependent Lon protease